MSPILSRNFPSTCLLQIFEIVEPFYFLSSSNHFYSALSATPPFPRLGPRLRLVSVLLPLCFAAKLIPVYAASKAMGLFAGFAFFGGPVIMRGLSLLNRRYPNWQKLLQIQKLFPRVYVYRDIFANDFEALFSRAFQQMLN